MSTFPAPRSPRTRRTATTRVKLIQFLSSHKAQQIYAEQTFEYPVEPGLEPSDMVKSFGVLKADTLPLDEIAKNRKEASEMVDRVGLDDGPAANQHRIARFWAGLREAAPALRRFVEVA